MLAIAYSLPLALHLLFSISAARFLIIRLLSSTFYSPSQPLQSYCCFWGFPRLPPPPHVLSAAITATFSAVFLASALAPFSATYQLPFWRSSSYLSVSPFCLLDFFFVCHFFVSHFIFHSFACRTFLGPATNTVAVSPANGMLRLRTSMCECVVVVFRPQLITSLPSHV